MEVLIAEDEMTSRMLLRVTLEKLGHTVTETADGKEALAVLTKKHYPLLISDWLMPSMCAPELCRLVRGLCGLKYTYIIVTTLLEGRHRCLEALEAGADDFLNKPLDIDHLVARVRVAERVMGLRTRLSDLEGLLSICMYCKRIRGEENAWMQVESYIESRSDLQFSHGMCPECYAREKSKIKPTKL